jgi:hypothetical protein
MTSPPPHPPLSPAAGAQALELEERAAQEILSSCRVIAATCIAAGDPRLVANVGVWLTGSSIPLSSGACGGVVVPVAPCLAALFKGVPVLQGKRAVAKCQASCLS